jgi:hypothetical protein
MTQNPNKQIVLVDTNLLLLASCSDTSLDNPQRNSAYDIEARSQKSNIRATRSLLFEHLINSEVRITPAVLSELENLKTQLETNEKKEHCYLDNKKDNQLHAEKLSEIIAITRNLVLPVYNNKIEGVQRTVEVLETLELEIPSNQLQDNQLTPSQKLAKKLDTKKPGKKAPFEILLHQNKNHLVTQVKISEEKETIQNQLLLNKIKLVNKEWDQNKYNKEHKKLQTKNQLLIEQEAKSPIHIWADQELIDGAQKYQTAILSNDKDITHLIAHHKLELNDYPVFSHQNAAAKAISFDNLKTQFKIHLEEKRKKQKKHE